MNSLNYLHLLQLSGNDITFICIGIAIAIVLAMGIVAFVLLLRAKKKKQAGQAITEVAEPAENSKPEPVSEPEFVKEQEPEVEVQPEPEFVEEQEPEVEVQPESEFVEEQEPEVEVRPEPEFVEEQEPEVEVQSEPELVEEQEPEVEVQHEPEFVEEQEPEVEVQPEPEFVEEREPEPVVEPAPVQQVESVVRDEAQDNDADDDEDSDADESIRTVKRINGHVRYIIIKYNKSFTAKIIQSSDEVKDHYSEIKNELLSYKGVKARMSWKGETFYSGRETYAKLCVRGKCLSLFLALDANDYIDSKYILEDKSEIATYEKTPCLYRLKNDRRIKYSKELIATVMGERPKLKEPTVVDWKEKYPYEEIEPLLERKLIKEITEEEAQSGDVFAPRNYVEANEVDELLKDEIANALIEETDEYSDKTKCSIINIDILSENFNNDETVTLDEIKKRIASVPKRTTYIKVLARGVLDKRLTVIADNFSIEAVKMILLTGGNVIRKKPPKN